MTTDLKDQIHNLMERGIQPVSAAQILARDEGEPGTFPIKAARSRRLLVRVTGIAAGVVAVGCASAVVAAGAGGTASARHSARPGPAHRAPAVLTAADVRHLASASRLALATSGQAVVQSRETRDGALQDTSTDDITFDGQNWNDALTEVIPGVDGQPASTQSAVNRVVDGQAYDYFNAIDGTRWYHVTGPDAVSSMQIPDPRDLLAALAPAARFVAAGQAVLGGVPVTKLVATDPAAVTGPASLAIWPAGTVTALTVWADSSGVVRQLSVSATDQVHGVIGPLSQSARKLLQEYVARVQQVAASRQISISDARQIVTTSPLGQEMKKAHVFQTELITVDSTTTVRYSGIGQPQEIRVPAGAITIYAVG